MDQVKQRTTRRYQIEDDLLYFKIGRIVVPQSDGLHPKILKEAHDHVYVSHVVIDKKMVLLYRNYFQTKIEDNIEAYVKSRLVCQLYKTKRRNEAGLLQPLPIVGNPWAFTSIDFISGFPNIYDKASVMVVVDRFSK